MAFASCSDSEILFSDSPHERTERLTGVRRTTQEPLFLSREKRKDDLFLERHVRTLHSLRNSEKVCGAGRIVVCARGTPSTKASSGIIVRREDGEWAVGGFVRGIAADDVGREAGEEGAEGALCTGCFDFLYRGRGMSR